MRIIHLLVIAAMVFAAAYVYRIKMGSTSRTERVLRLHAEIREQRDAIAVLRAEWARLDAPLRLQGLAERHLTLKPLNATQYDSLKNLPERPPRLVRPGDPRRIIDKDEAIELLTATLPDLDTGEVRDRLSSKKGFVWLKREITPLQQQEIHRFGIPGIGFLRENKRVYPTGNEVAHLIGLVNIDNQGIAGMEKWLDSNGLADLHRAGFATDRLQRPVELSVDLRVEHALRDELLKAK